MRREAGALWDLLGLSPPCRVIDIGCGHGKHALALLERGANVVGLDLTAGLLRRARELELELSVRGRWIRGDMRRLPFRSGWADGALLMDAFGFFDSDAEHEHLLREAVRVLAEDRRLALKVVNGGLVLDDFRETEREERSGVTISIHNSLTVGPPRLIQRITIRGSHGQVEYQRRQRLYRADELCAALEQAGLRVVHLLGSPDGTPFDPATSSAMWIVAQRASVV